MVLHVQKGQKMQMNTAARIVAATLAVCAMVYTVSHFMVKYQTAAYEEWGDHMDDRVSALETKVFPDKDKVVIIKEKEKEKEDK
jgi:hypothetical protein